MILFSRLFLLVLILGLSACTEVQFASHVAKSVSPPSQNEGTFKVGKPYKVNGTWYYPKEQYEYTETGIASWYGPGFAGKQTANGEIYDDSELTAAHRTLQMPSLVRVTNLDNGKSLIVRVNDRGPYKRGRVLDVSSKAADLLGFKNTGTAKVKLELLPQESLQIASAARSGLSTKGYEVAANQGTYAIQTGHVYGQTETIEVASAGIPPEEYPAAETVEDVQTLPGATGISRTVPGHTRYGQFYPDPVVTEMPVTPTNIYVQAGSFANAANAQRLSQQLQGFGATKVTEAFVNGRQFYRVRVGPAPNVDAADALLARVVSGGYGNAIIVVE